MEYYEFKTKDSDEAAFLLTMDEDFRLVEAEPIEKYGKVSVWFTFSTPRNPESVESLRSDYRHNKCLVEPRCHSDRRVEIRSIVKECLNTGKSKKIN